MSIWKFRLYYIPEQMLLVRYESLPLSIPMELAEECDWWADVQPPAGFESEIEATLPQKESWSKSARMWGWEVGGDVQIWYRDERKISIEQIQFRIDSRAVSQDLIRTMCALARQIKCVLMTADYKIVPADEATVLMAFKESAAKKFIVDPEETLEGLDQAEIQKRIESSTRRPSEQ